MKILPDFNQVSAVVSDFDQYLDMRGFILVSSRDGGMYGNMDIVILDVALGKFYECGAYQSSGMSRNFTASLSNCTEISLEVLLPKYHLKVDPRLPKQRTTVFATRWETEKDLLKKDYIVYVGEGISQYKFGREVDRRVKKDPIDWKTMCSTGFPINCGVPSEQITVIDMGEI